jgi:choline kinase
MLLMGIMNQFDVVLLAAGKGVRLGDLTNDSPKCLLPISGEKTILDVYLDYFIPKPQIRSICIIGGYAFSSLSEHLLEKWYPEFEIGKIVLMQNPIYDTSNNIVTFVQAAPFFSVGGVLIEADLVCSPDLYNRVLMAVEEDPEKSFLVIDESRKDRPDAMRISKHPNGMIAEIGKEVNLEISEGEFLGISYLSPGDASVAVNICRDLIAKGSNQLFYEEGFALGSANQILQLHSVPTDKSEWSEVDDVADYQRARDLQASFLPG